MDFQATRGQTAVLAFVLIVGIVAAGSAAVLLFGGSATDQSRDQVETERVEKAFLELDNRIASISRSEGGQGVVDMDLPDDSKGAVREADAGRMVIYRENITSGKQYELVDRKLGAIVYEHEGTHFAYQAGGVWRGTGNQSRMVSAPSISYAVNKGGDEPTLNVPLPVTSGAERLTAGDVRIVKDETISPINDVTIVEGDLVIVEIESKYYRAWADYFQTITEAEEVTLDHANETAIVELVVPIQTPEIEGGVIVGAPGQRLRIKQDATVDSYNSSEGDYAATSADTTRVIAAGDVELNQNATIFGSLEVGGDVDLGQNATITGNFRNESAETFTTKQDAEILGWQAENASVSGRPKMDGVIDRNVALIRENNRNNDTANVSGRDLDSCVDSGNCRLKSGNYLLDGISMDDNEKLTLDTSGGPVNIAVLGDIKLQDDAEIEVTGGSRVNLYLDSESNNALIMKNRASVTVPDDRAPKFWLYTDSDAKANIQHNSDFTGVIYGPGDGEAGTEIQWQTTSGDEVNIYGAVVGDVEKVTQDIRIHYDEALAKSTAVRTAIAVPRVTFLHASVYKVELDDE